MLTVSSQVIQRPGLRPICFCHPHKLTRSCPIVDMMSNLCYQLAWSGITKMQATEIPVREFSGQIIGIGKTPKFRWHFLVVPQIKRHLRRKHCFLPAYLCSSGKPASIIFPRFQLQFLPQAPVWSPSLTSLHDRLWPRSRRRHEPFLLHVGLGHAALLQQEKGELEPWAWAFCFPSTPSFESDASVAQVIWVLPSSCPGLRMELGFSQIGTFRPTPTLGCIIYR